MNFFPYCYLLYRYSNNIVITSLIIEVINIVNKLIPALIIIIAVLISVAYFTLVERKIMGFMQRRKGPNVVGFFGLLQPIADGVKLILKETVTPIYANKIIFYIAPVLTFFLSLVSWAIIPFSKGMVLVDINLGVFFLFAISSLGVYGIICAGWSSNSKYPFLGALRSAAQMISYEVSFALILIAVIFSSESLNLTIIVESQKNYWYIIFLLPAFIMFFISTLAETNRPPFDLPEAEAELVSGYNVEYSSMIFALFFLAEYSNMLLMSSLNVIFFLGGWFGLFGYLSGIFSFTLKLAFFIFLFVWVRAAFPRLRYDQLMFLGWKVLLPISLGYLLFIAGFLFFI